MKPAAAASLAVIVLLLIMGAICFAAAYRIAHRYDVDRISLRGEQPSPVLCADGVCDEHCSINNPDQCRHT